MPYSHIQARYFVLDILFSLQSCFVFNGVQHLPPFFLLHINGSIFRKLKKNCYKIPEFVTKQ